MEREIKLRIWVDSNNANPKGRMYYPGDEVEYEVGKRLCMFLFSQKGEVYLVDKDTINCKGFVGAGVSNNGICVMQYTGLKDKNEKEIYEGDIVEFTYWWFDGNEAESTLTGSVVYLPESMSYGLEGVKNKEWIKHIGGEEGGSDTAPFANWTFDEADFSVIGNIYENPNLLNF